jgi:hypothetical protein
MEEIFSGLRNDFITIHVALTSGDAPQKRKMMK